MRIDFGSLAFNVNVNGKVGGTPSWGTAIVYQTADNKIKEDIAKDILIGMIYNKIDCTSHELSLPLGKGGHIYYGDEDFSTNLAPSVPYLAAKFEKTYINGMFIGKPFILLVMKDGYEAHNGRLQLKYSPKITWGSYANQEFFNEAFKILGISPDAPFICYDIEVYDQDALHFRCAYKEKEYKFKDKKEYDEFITNAIQSDENIVPLVTNNSIIEINAQTIFYGAPGTGKSHAINEQIKGESVIRTTFHPDSDYSTFVGAYKPTTKEVELRDVSGHKIVENGNVVTEDRIIYEFVDQAFLQAYIKAWKFYAENEDYPQKQYLVIEEINRGNCAQIFGDLFQLLDRNQWGFSEYPINADKDMKKQLKKAFNGLSINNPSIINSYYKGRNVIQEVFNGDILILPNNLFIWATMNTSDQSLFPIDSAFKRRWDWQYMPIAQGRDKEGNELQWIIDVDGNKYSWWSFIEKINTQIGEATQSEDKKLGFFFCKANNGVISPETFVGKVVFYLWNDVFKDYGFEGSIFKDADNSELSFNKFYKADVKGNAIVQKDRVELFLNNLGVELIENRQEEEPEEDEDGNNSTSTTRDYTKYSINGVGRFGKNLLASECVKEYIKLYPLMTADEVLANWKSLGNIVPHFIESVEEHNLRKDKKDRIRYVEIKCGDTYVYVEKNGYGSNGKAQMLMDAVNQKGWGLTIERHNA